MNKKKLTAMPTSIIYKYTFERQKFFFSEQNI